MKKQLLISSVLAMTAVAASAFEWEPVSLNPISSAEVTSQNNAENVSFLCYGVEGIAVTDVMPIWVDENGNEIKAISGIQDDWNPNQFFYEFNFSDFKANGEYVLLFPEGMLVNAAGEKSDKIENYYTFDIPALAAAMFDDFKVLSIDPDLSQPQAVWDNQVMTVNTNHNDAIGVTTLSIFDTTSGESIVNSSSFSAGRKLGDSSPISWEVVGPYKFLENHTYKAELIFYNGENEMSEDGVPTKVVDRVSYEFTGRVEGFRYSDITLLSVEPLPMSDPNSVVISDPSQAVFTYTFSGPVTIVQAYTPLGQNGQETYPETCLSSNEDKTVWTLDLSDNSYVKSVDAVLTICINVRDLDGFQLQGDEGEESLSYFIAEWKCDLGGKPIVLVSPAPDANLESLKEIVVKSESDEPMTWAWTAEANVLDSEGESLGTLVVKDPAEGEEASSVEYTFTQMMDNDWNIVSLETLKDGSYSVVFDPGCFVFGDQFTSYYSKSLTFSFTIGKGNGVGGVNEASVSDVYDIHGRLVLRKASDGAVNRLPAGIYVKGGRKVVVK